MLGSEQVCDCANCCETCVPTMLNESVRPLFCLRDILLKSGQGRNRGLGIRQWRREAENPLQREGGGTRADTCRSVPQC